MFADFFWLCAEYLCVSALMYCMFAVIAIFFNERLCLHLNDLELRPMQEYAYLQLVRLLWFIAVAAVIFVALYCAWSWRFTVTSACFWTLKKIFAGTPPSAQSSQMFGLIKRAIVLIHARRVINRKLSQ